MQLSNRLVKDDFWTDTELMENLPPAGRMFYQGLWQLAESSGVLEYDVTAFKVQLFPLDSEVTREKLQEWTDTLVDLEKLIVYEADGKKLIYVKNFHKHQSLRNPGKPDLPLPNFINYLPNSEPRKSGWYLVDYDLLKNGQRGGKELVGSRNDDFKKQWGDVNDSLTSGQRDEREREREGEVERESESELEGEENKSDSKSDDPSEKYNDFAPTTSRGLDYEQIKELWNDRVPEALQIRTITDKRKRHLRARYKESDFALNDIINAIQEQPFLLGENDRGWVADFTWIIENQDHYTNILERKYKDAKFNGKTESEYIKEL